MFWSWDHSGYKHFSELIVAMPSKYVIFTFLKEWFIWWLSEAVCCTTFLVLVLSPGATGRVEYFQYALKNLTFVDIVKKKKKPSRPSLAVVGRMVFLLLQTGSDLSSRACLWMGMSDSDPCLLLPEWELTVICCAGTDCAVSVLIVFWMQR